MKSVLISIRPQWVEKIANGEKTIEVRKTAPKEVPFKCYIYCSKDNANEIVLLKNYKNRFIFGDYRNADGHFYTIANGKVIGEFICNNVDKYTFSHYEAEYRVTHVEQDAMCLNQPELIRYGKGETLYGWHISDLKIYDKPKELSEFKTPPCEKNEKACANCKWLVKINTPDVYECECYVEDGRPITRPPRSYMFVEEVKE